ncbi:leu operon leader peptide [Enterobacteriaceae bacterium RIT693]|nr:leu operon leader peptide [Enterobacteriaceae bacterium RIT693]
MNRTFRLPGLLLNAAYLRGRLVGDNQR